MTSSSTTKKLFIVTAGGTGGHMFPALALASELQNDNHKVHFITDVRGAAYIKPYDFMALDLAGLGRRSVLQKAIGFLKLGRGLFQALFFLLRHRPRMVVGFGGHPALPTLVAAVILHIPIVIHEQNAVLGRVNRLIAPWAKAVAVSFPETKGANKKNWITTGMPVREDIRRLRAKLFQLPKGSESFNVLVLGGSQGATVFSEVVPQALQLLPKFLRARVQVTQQCRPENLKSTSKFYKDMMIKAEVASFFDDIPQRLAHAHLVISRSGASTCSELMVSGRAAILVPYPLATDDHQTVNASVIVDKSGGWMIAQNEFTPERLAAMLQNLLTDSTILLSAAEAVRGLGEPDAAKHLVNLVYEKTAQSRTVSSKSLTV